MSIYDDDLENSHLFAPVFESSSTGFVVGILVKFMNTITGVEHWTKTSSISRISINAQSSLIALSPWQGIEKRMDR